MKKDVALQKLGKFLIGTWKISGEAKGKIKYAWLHEDVFLMQEFDLIVFDRRIKGIEIIGHLRKPNQAPSQEIWSRAYIFSAGQTFDYVYQLKGRNITIWFEDIDSPNKFSGKFNKDGHSYEGAWVWPGGGYEIRATRMKTKNS